MAVKQAITPDYIITGYKDTTINDILEKYHINFASLCKANEDNYIPVQSLKKRSADYVLNDTTNISVKQEPHAQLAHITGFYNEVSEKYLTALNIVPSAKSLTANQYSILARLYYGNILQLGFNFYEVRKCEKTVSYLQIGVTTTNIDVTVKPLGENYTSGADTVQNSESVADYLKKRSLTQKLGKDIKIIIPRIESGHNGAYIADYDDNDFYLMSVLATETDKSEEDKVSETPVSPEYISTPVGYSGSKNCFFFIYERGQLVTGPVYIPVIPQEVTDRNSAFFQQTSILGRSVSYQTYNGSSRSLNLSLEMHEELCNNYDYVPSVVRLIESIEYPGYETGQVNPCEMELVIGNHFRIRGIVSGVGSVWKTPFIDGRYVHCIVSFEITETTGPYSRAEIARMGARRS